MRIVYTAKSSFQHIMLVEQERVISLVLDGAYQTPLPNNEYYKHMLAPNDGSMSVAILGGGDMTCVPVLNMLGVGDWRLYEIDEEVIDACALHCPVPRSRWAANVVIGDALVGLREGKISADHIVVDLLGMTQMARLADVVGPTEFVDLLCQHAASCVSGFTAGGTAGILFNEILRAQFAARGFRHFVSMVNSSEEAFFIASKAPISLARDVAASVVGYPVYPSDMGLMSLSLENAITVFNERF